MIKVVIAGAGAHCKVVLDVLQEHSEYEVIGLLDIDTTQQIFGIPVIGNDERLQEIYNQGVRCGFVAIGNNHIRQKVQQKMERIGFEILTLVSSHAVVSRYASLGAGTILMPGSVVNAQAHIGRGCILNTNCSVDHDCQISDFCHIAPGCAISGNTKIGMGTFLGTGVKVIDDITIGENTMVGAGATVVDDLPENCLALGTPAQIREKDL